MNILLIWDIDGTLINCKGVGRKAMNCAFEKVYGVASGFDKVNMSGRLDKGIVREAFQFHGIKDENLDHFYEAYGKALNQQMAIHQPYVHEGVTSILNETQVTGRVLNAVGTGNCEVGAKMKLRFTGLEGYMRLGSYGSDHDERWALIEDVIEQAKTIKGSSFDQENIYVIGDTPRDIIAGQKNNVKTIALETGGYSKEALLEYNPDFTLPSLSDKTAFYKAIRL